MEFCSALKSELCFLFIFPGKREFGHNEQNHILLFSPWPALKQLETHPSVLMGLFFLSNAVPLGPI